MSFKHKQNLKDAVDMGNKCCPRTKPEAKIVLLLLGLDNAGKTAAVKGLAGEPPDTVPTVGFSVISLPFHHYSVKVYDLGGGPGIRGIWPQYFVDAHGIIFVVDSSDTSRMDEVKQVLHNVLSHEKITGKPVLLLANKQDQENALDEIDLVDKLDLEKIVNENHCPTLVETCSATEAKTKVDAGIKKGYHWLVGHVVSEYEKLNQRVEQDVKNQQFLEQHLLQEKIAKLQKAREQQKKISEEDKIESFAEYSKQLNGVSANTTKQELIEPETNLASSSNSSSSSNSLPPVYYNLHDDDKLRPKSATQIIKQHLELEAVHRKSPIRLISNKTAPISIYGLKLPKSADEKRRQFRAHRNLKSAGDCGLTGSDMPNFFAGAAADGTLHRQLFELNHFSKVGRSDPRKQNRIEGENAISIVEVD